LSDNYLRLIPTDPQWAPDQAAADRGLAALGEVAPRAQACDAEHFSTVTFFDPGGNLEEIRCAHCGDQLAIDWFQEEMSRPSFDDLSATMPCCAAPASLNDLDYRWPAGFASFALSAMNPGRMRLTDAERRIIELALGHPVREIWAHY